MIRCAGAEIREGYSGATVVAETAVVRDNDWADRSTIMTHGRGGTRRVEWDRFREDPCEIERNFDQLLFQYVARMRPMLDDGEQYPGNDC